jgi:hypothetical protein
MAFENQQKKQKYMIIVFLVVLVITGAVVYFGFLKDSINLGAFAPVIPKPEGVGFSAANININFDMLDSAEFKKLTPFQDATPFTGKVGREEPFKPY